MFSHRRCTTPRCILMGLSGALDGEHGRLHGVADWHNMCIHTYIHAYRCISAVYMQVCVYVRMHACMCVCMCVCFHVSIHPPIHPLFSLPPSIELILSIRVQASQSGATTPRHSTRTSPSLLSRQTPAASRCRTPSGSLLYVRYIPFALMNEWRRLSYPIHDLRRFPLL